MAHGERHVADSGRRALGREEGGGEGGRGREREGNDDQNRKSVIDLDMRVLGRRGGGGEGETVRGREKRFATISYHF